MYYDYRRHPCFFCKKPQCSCFATYEQNEERAAAIQSFVGSGILRQEVADIVRRDLESNPVLWLVLDAAITWARRNEPAPTTADAVASRFDALDFGTKEKL